MQDLRRQLLNRKIKRIQKQKAIGKAVYTLVMLIIATMILIKIDSIEIMQTDTLNTLMDIETQIDDLSEKTSEVGRVYQSDEIIVQTDEQSLTDAHREYIERVCMAEARGGGIESMMAVAQVISDRSHLWDMTPYEVVTQDSQFAQPYQGEISAEAVQAVWAVFDEGMRAFDSNVTHFHSEGVNPYWTENKTFVGTRGGNRFYESNY